ncbi:MAG: ATP-binding cassette domain-containing protein [Bacteroidales bacterium]|nr:ATP-binding cassette domain-containing protein [Bacteroidales bacterium]
MISLNNISVHFAGTPLFDDISFIINRRDRIGLVGKNGAGKTTLMRIINGQMEPTTGQVASPSGSSIGYLPQEVQLNSRQKVIDEALNAFAEIKELERKIQRLTDELTNRTDYQTEAYHNLSQKLSEANERYDILGGATQHARAEKVLLGLGFERLDLERPLTEFSGGWQMRVELAKILLQSPELIMLDEPTNHLDIESIQWLENFLIDYPGAVLVVSHDRAFLDNVTTRTIEISMGKAYDYKACYSDYEMLREERLEQELAAYSNQQKQIAQVEHFITRFRAKNTKARQVQSKIKMLEKMEKVEVEDLDKSSIHFRFPEAPPSGKVVIEAIDVSKNYGSKQVLHDLNFMVARGERIAFVGRNGEGKTTLSRIIIGELEHQGQIKLGHNVKIGYYAQNQAEFLDPEKTVFQTLDDVAAGEVRKQTRNILGGFLFSGDDIDKKVKVLSGGEKSRLAIAKLLLEPVNLLVLDEPTNHLDMRSKDILKSALLQFNGTIILVSHDRDFLQGLTGKVFEFRHRKIKEFIGDVYDFIDHRNIESLKQLEAGRKAIQADRETGESASRQNWEQKKQFERELRKLQNGIEKAEKEIERCEKEMAELEKIIANPALDPQRIESGEVFKNYETQKICLAKAEKDWEQYHLDLEVLEKKQ